MIRFVEWIGGKVLEPLEEIGRFMKVLIFGTLSIFRPPWRVRDMFKQLEFVGVQSLTVVLIAGGFTGAVFALQTAYGFGLFGAEALTGSTVTFALTRSLGPVFSALMVTGRAGSAMAAEIGTMRVTEQVDALESMSVDPMNYLVGPRIFAGTLMLPVLSAVFTAVGMLGSYLVSVHLLLINEGAYLHRIEWYVDPPDFTWGLAKSAVYGFILAVVGCYKGLYVRGGAEGVGKATTESVVLSSVLILVTDYFLTDFLVSNGLWS